MAAPQPLSEGLINDLRWDRHGLDVLWVSVSVWGVRDDYKGSVDPLTAALPVDLQACLCKEHAHVCVSMAGLVRVCVCVSVLTCGVCFCVCTLAAAAPVIPGRECLVPCPWLCNTPPTMGAHPGFCPSISPGGISWIAVVVSVGKWTWSV